MNKIYGIEWEKIRGMDFDALLICSKDSMGTDAITGFIGRGIYMVLEIDIICSKFQGEVKK
jgi:hypothetical protein